MLGFVLQPTYRVRDGRAVVWLFGRLQAGPAFLVEERRFRPYFFVASSDAGLLARERGIDVEPTEVRDLSGHELLRVVVDVPAAVPRLRERIEQAGGRALEADIRFPYRFLIDAGIRTGVAIEGRPERLRPGLVRFVDPVLRPAEVRPELRTLSIDLETSPDASVVHSAALVGAGADEVHLVASRAVEGAVAHPDERALLLAVAARLRELDPDVLVGWNVVDFDLRTWAARCTALGLPDGLGRVDEPVGFQIDPGFTRQSRASVPGRMVLDGISLVRDAIRLEDYRLETAARTLLGRGKRIREVGDPTVEIERMFREDPEALAAYNREDARLVLEILEREGLLALSVERSLLSGMQLDRVGASIASFDLLYLPELRRRGFVAPSVDAERKAGPVTGGAVLEPTPGLFRDVAVYDWKSLYPSLIRTFHLDPLAHARAGDDAIAAPNGARFSRREAILPAILERFQERREAAKRRGDRNADQAIKIMMNALFGVLGAAACRFFDPEIANAITGFGQEILRWTRDALEGAGVRVLYGDTDSVFVLLPAAPAGGSAAEVAERLRGDAAREIERRVREVHGVEPRLELELERVYERFFLPHVRGGRTGSKKRYAGLAAGTLEIVGLESVRRDWPAVAARLQRGLLERIFSDRDPLPFVREVVAAVRSGELDAELVHAKRVRKGALDRYTATTPPHVQAARKAGGPGGGIVRYVIARSGPEPVLPGRPLPEGIDHEHAVEKILRPVGDAILREIGSSFDEALDLPRQLTLV